MALIKCEKCNEEISTEATKCPYCNEITNLGKQNKIAEEKIIKEEQELGKRFYIGLIAVILGVIIAIGLSVVGILFEMPYLIGIGVVVGGLLIGYYYYTNPEILETPLGVECPNCHSRKTQKIGNIERGISVSAWGLASSKIGKEHKCIECGHKW